MAENSSDDGYDDIDLAQPVMPRQTPLSWRDENNNIRRVSEREPIGAQMREENANIQREIERERIEAKMRLRNLSLNQDSGVSCSENIGGGSCSENSRSNNRSYISQSPQSHPHGIIANNLTKEQQNYLLNQLRSRVFTKNEDGDTYLHLSVIYEINDDVIKIVRLADNLENINEFNKLYQTPLLLAVLVRNPIISRLLVVAGADGTRVDMRGNTPLHIACELKESEIVKMLVDEPRDEERSRYFPQLSYEPAPKYICRKAIYVTNYRGYYPIHIAYFSNFQEGITILLKAGARIDDGDRCSGKTILHFAVEEGYMKMIKFLIEECKADVNCKTFGDRTPLDFATYMKNEELKKYLTSKGGKLFEYHSTSTSEDEEDENDLSDWENDDDFDDLQVRRM